MAAKPSPLALRSASHASSVGLWPLRWPLGLGSGCWGGSEFIPRQRMGVLFWLLVTGHQRTGARGIPSPLRSALLRIMRLDAFVIAFALRIERPTEDLQPFWPSRLSSACDFAVCARQNAACAVDQRRTPTAQPSGPRAHPSAKRAPSRRAASDSNGPSPWIELSMDRVRCHAPKRQVHRVLEIVADAARSSSSRRLLLKPLRPGGGVGGAVSTNSCAVDSRPMPLNPERAPGVGVCRCKRVGAAGRIRARFR